MTLRLKSNLLVFVLSIMLLSSCASILNSYHQDVKVHTSAPAVVVYKKDSISTKNNKVVLSLQRNDHVKEIRVYYADSLEKTIVVRPFKSVGYWLNIPCTYGIGLLVDKNNDKRYGHPNHIYVKIKDTLTGNGYATYNNFDRNFRKGTFKLHVSLPWVNSFYLHPSQESAKSNTGFMGVSIGLDYYHVNNQYLSLSTRAATDFLVPFPAPYDFSGEHEFMNYFSVSLTNNYNLNRFSLGYGFTVAKNTWDLRYYKRWDPPLPSRDPVSKSHYTLGLTFPAYIQLAKSFNIGVIYSPSFYRPALLEKFKYEHLIHLDFAWKIRL